MSQAAGDVGPIRSREGRRAEPLASPRPPELICNVGRNLRPPRGLVVRIPRKGPRGCLLKKLCLVILLWDMR